MARSMFAGATDYSIQPFNELIQDLNSWRRSINDTLKIFDLNIQNLQQSDCWNEIYYDLIMLFNDSVLFFKRYKKELQEICCELKLKG